MSEGTTYKSRPPQADEILRYLYGEMHAEEKFAFEEALSDDENLYAEFTRLKFAVEKLPAIDEEPSETAVQNILNYAEENYGGKSKTRILHLPSVFRLPLVRVAAAVLIFIGAGIFVAKKNNIILNPSARNATKAELLNWDTNFESDIQFLKTSVNNLEANRVLPLEIYGNTYRVINPKSFTAKNISQYNNTYPAQVVVLK